MITAVVNFMLGLWIGFGAGVAVSLVAGISFFFLFRKNHA